ncbi:hypothetical protein [Salinivibrio sp. PR919]|uniref:hypothetical protein n=1 Tax=Salinivibrio sp. PR919 TaxID=1909491 RepID=UPI001056061D|nr:hypothetical protein [Salinivibrio sp. PR919]
MIIIGIMLALMPTYALFRIFEYRALRLRNTEENKSRSYQLFPYSVFRIPYSVFRIPYSVFRIPYSVFRIPSNCVINGDGASDGFHPFRTVYLS